MSDQNLVLCHIIWIVKFFVFLSVRGCNQEFLTDSMLYMNIYIYLNPFTDATLFSWISLNVKHGKLMGHHLDILYYQAFA